MRISARACTIGLLFCLATPSAWAQVDGAPRPPAQPVPPVAPPPDGEPAQQPDVVGARPDSLGAEGEAEPVQQEEAAEDVAAAEALREKLQAMQSRPGGLTSEEVARRTVQTSRTLRGRRIERDIADLDIERARQAYLPQVTLLASYTRKSPVDEGTLMSEGRGGGLVGTNGSGPLNDPSATPNTLSEGVALQAIPLDALSFPTPLNEYFLQGTLEVPLSDYALRSNHGLSAARHNERFALLNEQASQLTEAANARLAYYNWVRTKLQLVVSAQSYEQVKAQLEQSKILYRGGRLSRADVLRGESQVARGELIVTQARQQEILARDRLRTLMHDTGAGDYEIGEAVMSTPPVENPGGSVEVLYQESLRNRLEIKALGANASALREAGKATRADQYPRLSAFGNVYYANPNPRIFPQEEEFRSTWDVGVRATWTPTRIGVSRAEAKRYEAQANQQETEAENLKDALRAEVLESQQAIIDATANIHTAERGLEAAQEAYRVRRKLFHYGRASGVEVTDAEVALLEARLSVINARVSLIAARIRLDHATGRDVSRLADLQGVTNETRPRR